MIPKTARFLCAVSVAAQRRRGALGEVGALDRGWL